MIILTILELIAKLIAKSIMFLNDIVEKERRRIFKEEKEDEILIRAIEENLHFSSPKLFKKMFGNEEYRYQTKK